ncbi:hypothetical protein DIZ27_04855 [Streptomyces sp. NWU339]|nr:hypothetical protein DIZ27_04855 [Streptomyces sp. NWU339]
MFVAVAETGAISRAAERLMVSESAVSLALGELERPLRTLRVPKSPSIAVELRVLVSGQRSPDGRVRHPMTLGVKLWRGSRGGPMLWPRCRGCGS